jgi:hypothetical protein
MGEYETKLFMAVFFICCRRDIAKDNAHPMIAKICERTKLSLFFSQVFLILTWESEIYGSENKLAGDMPCDVDAHVNAVSHLICRNQRLRF